MKITREKLSEIAGEFLAVLEKEEVKTTRDLESLAGQAIPLVGENNYLIVGWRNSNARTMAIDASYIIQHRKGKVEGGIPLNLRINSQLGYSQVIVKVQENIIGYESFAEDTFGNIVQSRILKTTDFNDARRIVGELKPVGEKDAF
jgi:hypothetical protein